MQTEHAVRHCSSLYVSYTQSCVGRQRRVMHIRDISVIKRGRPLFPYLGRVSPINTATRCCLNIYSARVEDSINLTNLNMENYIINCTYRFYLHCKILVANSLLMLYYEVKRRNRISLSYRFLPFRYPFQYFFYYHQSFIEFESSKRSNEVSKTFFIRSCHEFSIRQNKYKQI